MHRRATIVHAKYDCPTSFGTVLQNMLKLHASLYELAVTHDTEYKRAHITPLLLLFCDLEAIPRQFHAYESDPV